MARNTLLLSVALFSVVIAMVPACVEQSVIDSEIIIPGTFVLVDDEKINGEPSWSPDGMTIAYTAVDAEGSSIWEVSAAGGEPKPLVNEANGEHSPTYSPSGGKIALTSKRAGSFDIWTLDLQNSSLTQLTTLDGDEKHPRWSPDGSWLAFVSQGRLAIVAAFGGSVTYLTDKDESIQELCWDETGVFIYYSHRINQISYLSKFNLTTKEKQNLPQSYFSGGYPAIAKTDTPVYDLVGTQLAYESSGGISVYSFADNSKRPIIISGNDPCWSPDGNQIVYSKNGNICIETVWVLFNDN